jgi:ABC-type oligopeptide transport system substrate-binding subunit
MKRSSSLSWLLDRQTPWLPWWQELILNWVASWSSIGTLVVTQANGDKDMSWNLPTDLELQRAQLEELVQ